MQTASGETRHSTTLVSAPGKADRSAAREQRMGTERDRRGCRGSGIFRR